MVYPPLSPAKLSRLKAELALAPRAIREDALQEAWVAHLSGDDPISAIRSLRSREYRYRQRKVASLSDDEAVEELSMLLYQEARPSNRGVPGVGRSRRFPVRYDVLNGGEGPGATD